MKDVLFIVMVVIAALVGGCTESKAPVWGKGELPAEYTSIFGNNNGARLDYVQNQMIDKHNKVIAELAKRVIALEGGGDPNE